MIFLLVLAIATACAALVLKVRGTFTPRRAALLGMAAGMAFAGLSHLLMPTPFIQHLPTWVPMREPLIFVTGLLEIALAAALLPARRRRLAGFALAGYLLAVFPSNVYVAVAQVEVEGQPGGLYPWLRLPLQLVFIAWALWASGATDRRTRSDDEPAASAGPRLFAS